MSSANSDFDEIHLGFWTNWSHGKTRGATLTLTRGHGTLLIAFLAIFVAAAGKSFWRVLCFGLHTLLSEPSVPQDGLHHQRQAILRNSETAFNGSWQLFNAVVVWKRKRAAPRILRRTMPIVVAALLISSGFTLAGIFASQVSADVYNEVLLAGKQCGYANYRIDYQTYVDDFLPWSADASQSGLLYARSCYKEDQPKANTCKTYVKPRLPFTSDRNATCPFEEDICQSQFGNIMVDTGHVSVHEHMGLNTVPEDRITFRFVHHCAPLKTRNFSRYITVPDEKSGLNISMFQLFYGEFANYTDVRPGYSNYTYQFPANETRVKIDDGNYITAPIPDYAIGAAVAWANKSTPTYIAYEPVSQLRQPESDVALLFLSAPDIDFSSKVTDPWFAAQTPDHPQTDPNSQDETAMMYNKDEPVTTLGCTRQTQYCLENLKRPDGERCERLRGYTNQDFLWNTTVTDRQMKILRFIDKFTTTDMIESLATVAGPIFLVARSGLRQGTQGPLPDNQWQLEIENLIAGVLANIQRSIIDGVNGPATPGIAKIWQRSNQSVEQELCRNQKVLSSRYPSFSVLGIALIFGIGGCFIILELVLERLARVRSGFKTSKNAGGKTGERGNIFGKFRRHPGPDDRLPTTRPDENYGRLVRERVEWNLNSTLQLQRLAHEAIGAGTWERTSSETPVTLPNQTLGTLAFRKLPASQPYFISPHTGRVPAGTVDNKQEKTNGESPGSVDRKDTIMTISTCVDSEKVDVADSEKSLK